MAGTFVPAIIVVNILLHGGYFLPYGNQITGDDCVFSWASPFEGGCLFEGVFTFFFTPAFFYCNDCDSPVFYRIGEHSKVWAETTVYIFFSANDLYHAIQIAEGLSILFNGHPFFGSSFFQAKLMFKEQVCISTFAKRVEINLNITFFVLFGVIASFAGQQVYIFRIIFFIGSTTYSAGGILKGMI